MNVVPAAEGLAPALAVLRDGGIVIHATETCYGIACDLSNPAAVRKLFTLKQRPFSQPVSALFPTVAAAKMYVEMPPKAEALCAKYLPGPLTLVLTKKQHAPALWLTVDGQGQDPSVGVRVSSHPFAMQLAEAFGLPIATTSANLHAKPNPYSLGDIEAQWEKATQLPDLVVDSGTIRVTPPSTVVRVDGDTLTVLRRGLTLEDETSVGIE